MNLSPLSPSAAVSAVSPPLELGILLYPGMTLLDFAGPQAALGMHGRTHLLAKTLAPVMTDSGVAVLPTATYADYPPQLDILLVPGGLQSNAVMQDDETLAFLAEIGQSARYITSVCSGSLILGAAGLLTGYQAATHWACYDALEALGIDAVHERVVLDRNRCSGGGVTAGLDFGLTLLAELRGELTAKVTQLAMEYNPHPPFQVGSPELAGPELTAAARAAMGNMAVEAVAIAQTIRKSWATPAAT